MRKFTLFLLAVLVLTIPALAFDGPDSCLYWDDFSPVGSLDETLCGVMFHDAVGHGKPGDTDGEPGNVTKFFVDLSARPEDFDAVDLCIYDIEDGVPGDLLAGPLHYEIEHTAWEDSGWYLLVLDDPVYIDDGEFLASVESPTSQYIGEDQTSDWGLKHSFFFDLYEPGWQPSTTNYDLCIRVTYEEDSAVESVSWGQIKASY